MDVLLFILPPLPVDPAFAGLMDMTGASDSVGLLELHPGISKEARQPRWTMIEQTDARCVLTRGHQVS